MPDEKPAIDAQAAHRHFAAGCFNDVWSLIDKNPRTPEEDEQMLLLATASLWHWTQREDRADQNLSIGHWQVSRVYTMLGDGLNAKRHGERCLAFAAGSPPFFVGYGHEAIARAASLLGESEVMATQLAKARGCAAAVEDAGERKMLEADLDELDAKLP